MHEPTSPRDQAGHVRESVGPRPLGEPSAEARRPLVQHQSYVPSDVEPPKYGLPSTDYIRRYKQTQQGDVERAQQKRAEEGGEQARNPRAGRLLKKARSSPYFRIGLIACILAGLAVLALMAMASLAVYECAPHRDRAFANGPPGLSAPCIALTTNANGECATPGTFSAYANRTGGECCMPRGYVCGIDQSKAFPCAEGAVRVYQFEAMQTNDRMCCHPEGLGAEAIKLLNLDSQLGELKSTLSTLSRSGFKAEELDTIDSQLGALLAGLREALDELPSTLALLENVKAVADGQITQRQAAAAAEALRRREAAEAEAKASAKRAADAAALANRTRAAP